MCWPTCWPGWAGRSGRSAPPSRRRPAPITATPTAADTAMTDSPSRPDLLRLMAWLSPSFPTGAFSYSHGLEYAVEAGLVTDRAGLAGWIETILRRGSAHIDAV